MTSICHDEDDENGRDESNEGDEGDSAAEVMVIQQHRCETMRRVACRHGADAALFIEDGSVPQDACDGRTGSGIAPLTAMATGGRCSESIALIRMARSTAWPQAELSTLSSHGLTGLSLSGRQWCSSRPGCGSKFAQNDSDGDATAADAGYWPLRHIENVAAARSGMIYGEAVTPPWRGRRRRRRRIINAGLYQAGDDVRCGHT